MKTIVYTSETGHTARYAEMLSEELGLPAMSMEQAEKQLPADSEIFYLGWLMAGSIKGYKRAAKRFAVKGVAAVGMSDKPNGALWDQAAAQKGMVDGTRVFYLQGGYAGNRLRGLYRLMMKMMERSMIKQLSEKQDRTPEEDAMLTMFRDGGDCVRKENLVEILEWFAERTRRQSSL